MKLMKNNGLYLLSVLSLIALSGCMQGDERLIEKARLEGKATAKADLQGQLENVDLLIQRARAEGRAQAEESINANNESLAQKADLMEADLATRQLFYQSLRGTFEGTLKSKSNSLEYSVRISFVPAIAPYTNKRVRQLEEIASDLNNLTFSIQIVQWNPNGQIGQAVGCRAELIRADRKRGEVSIASPDCPNLYRFRIYDPEIANKLGKEVSTYLASEILDGKISLVNELVGEVQPSTSPISFTLSAKRVQTE